MLTRHFLAGCLCLVAWASAAALDVGEVFYFEQRHVLSAGASEREGAGRTPREVFRSPVSDAAVASFDGLLLNGMASDEAFEIQIRIVEPEHRWGPWRPVVLKVFPNGRFWGRLDIPGRALSQVQLRVIDCGMGRAGRVDVFAVEGWPGKPPEPGVDTGRGRSGVSPGPPKETLPMPEIVTREQWGAQPPIGTYVAHDPYRMTQHHTAGRRIQTLEEGLAEMFFIQDFHQNGRGWQDIGYHYCVDDAGRIYAGVPPDSRGTHTGGNNTGNIGISLFGNFDSAGEIPSPASLDSLETIWSWLAFHYEVNPDLLLGHRDYTATACPGTHLYPEITEMRNGIRQALALGAPFVAYPQPQPFSLEVAPESSIAFEIIDAEEGVDLNSIRVRVNGGVVTPNISALPAGFLVSYRPSVPFPSSRTVIVDVEAADLAGFPNWMNYSFSFTIEVEALHLEVQTANSMRNADLELNGEWSNDGGDVDLEGLVDGLRLYAVDDDGSHSARLYPAVESAGDFRVSMAVEGQFLGESAHFRFVNSAGLECSQFVEFNSVFDGRWGSLSPTPVHIDGGVQAEAFVEINGVTDLETRLVLDAIRLERVDPLDPPTAPTLKWVRAKPPGTNEVEIAWYPSLEGDILGYRLFVSPDGRTWGEPLVDETTLTSQTSTHAMSVEASFSTFYVRLLAVDVNGIESEGGIFEPFLSQWTDTYGAGFGSGRRILIVDNFDRMASWSLPYHAFVRSHGEAIASHRFGFDSCAETAVQTGEIELADYDGVFYFCGDDSRSDESLAAADQRRLLDYLSGGGKLLISGSEILYDFDLTTSVEEGRIQDLLRATYGGDDSGSNRIFGGDGTPFEGLDFIYGTIDSDEMYIEDYPDFIFPAGGSQTALVYENSRIAAISFIGAFGLDNPEAQLIYLAFPFETINQPVDRIALINRVFEFFGFPTQAVNLPPFEFD